MGQWLHAQVLETAVRPLPLDLYFKVDRKVSLGHSNLRFGTLGFGTLYFEFIQVIVIDELSRQIMKVSPSGVPIFVRQLPPSHIRVMNPVSLEHSLTRDIDHIGYLVWECMRRRQQTLIFCATKEWCQKAANFITRYEKCESKI